MLNFIRRWIFNRNRRVYTYWNGSRLVKGDPMVFYRELLASEDFASDDFKLLKVESLRPGLIQKLSGVIRAVFAVALPDAGGLTELECMDLLHDFMEYSGLQKKSGDQTPTLPPTTEPEHSADSTPEQNTSGGSAST